MTDKVNVLINTLGGGGAERQVSYLHRSLLTNKIYTLKDRNVFPISDESTETIFKELRMSHRVSIVFMLLTGPFQLFRCKANRGIVLSFLELSNFINIITKLMFRSHKAIISVRVSPSYYEKIRFGTLYRALIRFLYPRADLVTTNSHVCRAQLIKEFKLNPSKVLVVENAVDLEEIEKKNQLSNMPGLQIEGLTNFVMIGRLTKQKNYFKVLEAFKRAHQVNSKCRLLILGDGDEKEELLEFVSHNLGLRIGTSLEQYDRDVYFLGFVTNPYQYITSQSIFVLGSLYEGLPNVVLEAMACRAMVISADCATGPREILAPNSDLDKEASEAEYTEYGVLLPVMHDRRHIELWKECFLKCLHEKDMQNHYSQASYKRVQDYKLETVMGRWGKVFSKLQ